MSDSVVVYLPLNTYVSVRGFTDAAFLQQVTVQQEDGTKTVMTGSGEHEAPMQNGVFGIQTPGSSTNPAGYMVTVTVESQTGCLIPIRLFVSSNREILSTSPAFELKHIFADC